MHTTNQLQFSDIFVLEEIQQIQDMFSNATGVASIITHPDGRPITRPSNFCRLCNEIIRKTDKGLANCFKSDAEIGQTNPLGPVIKPCLSGGLWDAGASIIVGDQHIANWLIGQVKNEGLDSSLMIQYADEIGADRNDFMNALAEVTVMSKEKFEKVAQMLFLFANELSSKAYKNKKLHQSVSERNMIAEELAAERNLLRILIDNMPDRIYAKDLKGRFIICNEALVKRMGTKNLDDVIGKSDFDLLPPDSAAQYFANEQEILSSGLPLINHEESKVSEDGTTLWTLTTKVPLKDTNGKIIGIVGIGRDITNRKLAEEEITLKNELLQTINAEKDKFFSIIAHDLKGPLSAFLDATQILSDEIHNMSLEEIREITINMKDSASNLYGLLENLLEWSRLKRGLMDFNPVSVKINLILIQSIEVLKESARKKNIPINFSLPDDLEIFADLHMLETVVRNLVSNAIKFTPVGGEVIISAKKNYDNSVEINVIDSGIGMSPELKGKLFHISQKTSRQGTEGEQSTGLGLLLCKEFVERHNGKLLVTSEEKKGSTFSLIIPEVKINNGRFNS
jgi:PAS domain S-box-containing protein